MPGWLFWSGMTVLIGLDVWGFTLYARMALHPTTDQQKD